MKQSFFFFLIVMIGAGVLYAVSPPGLINYQGVLRDSGGAPLDGTYDMVFTFYSDVSAGDQILIDSHLAAGSGAVTVSSGLFNVALGSGAVTDGSGPGTYTTLGDLFAAYSEVWLQVNVGGEDLSPRTRVLASSYAQNAGTLQGVVNVDGSGNVGVGTSSAGSDLTVYSTEDDSGLTLRVSDNLFSQGLMFQNAGGAYTWRIYRKDAGSNLANLVFANGASNDLASLTDVVTFEDGGRVGIGVEDPTYKLEVAGDIHLTGRLRDGDTDPGTVGQVLSSTGTSVNWIDPATFNDSDWTVSGSDIYPAVSGNVGIGTDTPVGKLHVIGPFNVDGYRDTMLIEQTASNGTVGSSAFWQSFTIGGTGFVTRIEMRTRSPLSTEDRVTATLQIFEGEGAGGTLLFTDHIILQGQSISWHNCVLSQPLAVTVGTQYTFLISISARDQKLFPDQLGAAGSGGPYAGGRDVYSPDADAAFRVYMANSYLERVFTAGSAGNVGIGTENPAYQLQLSTDSAAKPGTNTWTVASDSRLKKNIRPFIDGLEVLKKIDPIRYQYNGLAGMPQDSEQIGIVAQDILKAAPYTVGTFRAHMHANDEKETELYDFNSHALTFVMINAIKELDRRTSDRKEAQKDVARKEEVDATQHESSEIIPDISGTDAADLSDRRLIEEMITAHPVKSGDVLVFNPANGEELYPCSVGTDPMVVGVAAAGTALTDSDGLSVVEVVIGGVAYVKADATMVPIRRGDLLVTSVLPGHALKAKRPYEIGTIIGKALEPLDSGTGLIKVLVMLR